MDFKRIFTLPKYLILVLAAILNFAASPFCLAISNTEIETLENDFQTLSNQLYTALSKNLSECQFQNRSIKRLNFQLQKLSKQNKIVVGNCLIQNNLQIIQKNIDNKDVFPVFQFLLDNNNLLLANKLYQQAKNEADKSLLSNISFMYAQFYLKRKKWNRVLQYTDGTYNDLTADNANQARLFTGIAMQKLKQHREAVKIYLKIPANSKYYAAARLNIATAYIRQDWWTDAHIKINEILNNSKTDAQLITNKEMINRSYLVLGYSLLNKEFYRDSREAFRNIEVDSLYFNKALLGIALTATNQEDYIGALNAINILKAKKSLDLSVDESHLLLPYIYEKLNQNMTASASYTDAQKYYEDRIKNITSIKNMKQYRISAQAILKNNRHIEIQNNIVDLSNHIQVGFLKNSINLSELTKYIPHINNANLINNLHKLNTRHNALLSKTFDVVFEQRLTYLNSYMNQSRFGLARLFDNSNSAIN